MITRGIRSWLLLLGALAAGCGPADLAVPDPGAPVPFHASSLDNDFFAFVGTFEGTYTLEPEAVHVFVRRAVVQLRDKGYTTGPRHFSALRVGLGHGSRADTWGTLSRSDPLPVDRMLRSGDEVVLDSLHFRIPVPHPWDLSRTWLVFAIDETLPGEDGGPDRVGTAFAHSGRRDGSAP